MNKKGIIGAGNWLVDTVKTLDRFPKEGELCNIKSIEQGGGGGPCNVLFDLAAMTDKIPLYAAGVLGKDAYGDYLMDEIAKRMQQDAQQAIESAVSKIFKKYTGDSPKKYREKLCKG